MKTQALVGRLGSNGGVDGYAPGRSAVPAYRRALGLRALFGIGRSWLGRRQGQGGPSGLDLAAAHMCQGLCMFDADGRLVASNRRFAEIYGLSEDQVRAGMTLHDIVALRYGAGASPQMGQSEYMAWRTKVGAYDRPNDSVVELCTGRIIAIHRRPMPDGGWTSTHEDITHRSRNEAQVAFLARHDALTGLPNRILFRERLNAALAEADGGRGVAVLSLDLDRFKQINDRLGHPIGDALLRGVAERLSKCVREMDTVARLGGDEFAIIQAGVAEPGAATLLAQRVIDALRTPFLLEGQKVLTNTSIGLTLAPRDGVQVTKLLKNADLALYQAKDDGRGLFRFFTPEMDAALAARRALEHDLQRAVQAEEFELHYQPQHDLATGEVTGFEALVRWNHPTRRLIQPAEFIPVAEDTGLITRLGRWTLGRACRDAARWPAGRRVAVNLSPAQFRDPALHASVTEALAASGLPPERLELEITESILLQNDDETLGVLRQFRDMGIQIAMDDFGSGYSSLAYLRRFPFTRVKIDRCFVHDLAVRPEAEPIVRAITQLARSLGMATTAEGVETQEQLAALRQTGCDEVQGFLFSVPVRLEEIPGLLSRSGRPMRAGPKEIATVPIELT